MFAKEKDPKAIERKISNKPIDYVKLNKLYEDFEKRFVPQQELSANEAFWYHMLNPSTKSSDALPVKIEAPKELPKVRWVNESLKKLKLQLANFDKVVKIRTTLNARTEDEWGFEHTKSMFLNDESVNMERKRNESCDKCFNLDDELLKSQNAYNDLLKRIGEQAKEKQPLDNALDFACKHAQRIHELLVYVRDTCPNAIKLNEKKVAVTPKNKVKKVKFAKPLTSSSNIKQVESSTTSDFNTPVLSPTRLKCSTSNYGSKPTDNKKNNRISQTPSRNMKNKVEAQPRKVNKKNRVVEPIVMMIHAKSAKKHKKQNIWKPTGHVFIEVGLKWKPTGRTFTIVGNSRPLTRITSDNIVPPKATTSHSVETQKPKLKVYTRKPKNVKNIGCLDCSLASGLRMSETYDREPVTPLFVKKTLCHNLGVISKHS
uniref:Integrase, catalytic region, zinc finger, CCHC-type, peptidase aspartic, catalytic n=1 Tax=Tanacetum cinerariifolium TaxID=118510 RepID=A0A699HHJ8_TANCI|nr:hypothetical protein [Tanacetum cinerariifolium]